MKVFPDKTIYNLDADEITTDGIIICKAPMRQMFSLYEFDVVPAMMDRDDNIICECVDLGQAKRIAAALERVSSDKGLRCGDCGFVECCCHEESDETHFER